MSALPLVPAAVAQRPERKLWLWPHLLSLDAPIVAVLWQWFFVHAAHESWKAAPAIALALAVWLVYAADRLLDVRRGQNFPNTSRHWFYFHHRQRFEHFVACGIVGGVWFVVRELDPAIAWRGVIVAACVGAYLLAVHAAPVPLRCLFPKELSVGLLFAAGTGVSIFPDAFRLLMPLFLFGMLCWANCAAIESWETGAPARLRQPLGMLAAFTVFCFIAGAEPRLFLAEAISAIGLLLLHEMRDNFSQDALRVLADAALCTPLLFL